MFCCCTSSCFNAIFRQYLRKTDSGIGRSKVKLKLRVDIKTQLCLVLRKLTFKIQGLCSNNHHPFNPNTKAMGGNDVWNLIQSRHLAALSKGSVIARASCSMDIQLPFKRTVGMCLSHNPIQTETMLFLPPLLLINAG